MPYRPPRVCHKCRRTVKAGRCPCTPAWSGSTSPGSTRRWRKLREVQLSEHPICQCKGCKRHDGQCRYPASEVDHIVPLAEDPTRRYDEDNIQSLCDDCHEEKTAVDALRGKRRAR